MKKNIKKLLLCMTLASFVFVVGCGVSNIDPDASATSGQSSAAVGD